MAVTKQQKLIAYFAAGFIFVFIIGRVFIFRFSGQLKTLAKQIKIAEEELEKGIKIQKVKDLVIDDYNRSRSYMDLGIVAPKQITAKLLKEVETIISLSKGKIISLSPQESAQDNIARADFRLEMDWEQLFDFLYRIQQSQLLIKLEKFNVSSRETEEEVILKVEGVVGLIVP